VQFLALAERVGVELMLCRVEATFDVVGGVPGAGEEGRLSAALGKGAALPVRGVGFDGGAGRLAAGKQLA